MRYLIFLVFVNLFTQGWSQECDCDSIRDYQAMKRFANAMTSHPWDTTKALKDWKGIQLNDMGCVTTLGVVAVWMQGQIPPSSIGQLSCLESLELTSCKLQGTIPSDFVNLQSLRSLRLIDNEFIGPIPVWISNLPSLTHLTLSKNFLTGSIPPEFGNMVNLEAIILSENLLTGKIPDSFKNLVRLHTIALNSNRFSGRLQPFFQNMSILSFNISDNQFQDTAWVNLFTESFGGTVVNISNNDFNHLPLITSSTIREEKFMIQNNRFTFDDIQPNFHLFFHQIIIGGISPERYTPQKPFSGDTTIRFSIFDTPVIRLGIDESTNNNKYIWYKDNDSIYTGTAPQLNLNDLNTSASQYAGKYQCEVTNNDVPLLTLHSGTITVEVDESFSSIRTPGAFSPNGDGINDYFIIPILITESIEQNELVIYNRFHEIVFQQTNYANQWDGTDLGQQPLPNGTYYYIFRAKGVKESGMVTILRTL